MSAQGSGTEKTNGISLYSYYNDENANTNETGIFQMSSNSTSTYVGIQARVPTTELNSRGASLSMNADPTMYPDGSTHFHSQYFDVMGVADSNRNYQSKNLIPFLIQSGYGENAGSDDSFPTSPVTLDVYTDVGYYNCKSNSKAAALYNCPTSSAFTMRVWDPTGDFKTSGWAYRIQEITTYVGDKFYRSGTMNNTTTWTWSAWTQIAGDTGLKTLSTKNGATGTITYGKKNGWVYVSFENVIPNTTSAIVVATLPSGYRPAYNVQPYLRRLGNGIAQCWISTNGDIHVATAEGTVNHAGFAVYPCN